MKDRPTPRTNAHYVQHGLASLDAHWLHFARMLESETAELRELYDLDTQFLRAERDEARDALRVRIEQARVIGSDAPCGLCGRYVGHAETCRHYATEMGVMR